MKKTKIKRADFFFCDTCPCCGFKYTDEEDNLIAVFAHKQDCNYCMDNNCIFVNADKTVVNESWDDAIITCAFRKVITPLTKEWHENKKQTNCN